MARRKVSHYRRIISKTSTSVGGVKMGDIIQFNYRGDNIYDKSPMVFVLFKAGKLLDGININYMKEYKVQRLLEETNFKNLKYYSLYEDSFRTYTISKMKMIKIIDYKTDEMINQEKEL